ARVVHEPTAVAEHRSDVRALAKALKKAKAELAPGPDATLLDGGVAVVTDDDAARDAVALLATRLEAYGVERLVLSDA
ncbi:MAG TPA: hypothetical protein PK788_12670, partial [Gemmatimonadaceae bacterium]|nr:hypothetical protein [Gemmatimonadaceae bacterium]